MPKFGPNLSNNLQGNRLVLHTYLAFNDLFSQIDEFMKKTYHIK